MGLTQNTRFLDPVETQIQTPTTHRMKNLRTPSFTGILLVPGALHTGCVQEPATKADYWAHLFSVDIDLPYGDSPEQRLDVYSQGQPLGEPLWWKGDSINHPTLIFFHGGGWMGGKKETQTPNFIPYLQAGWNVVNVEYRLGENTAPNAVDDAMCAIAWVAENADAYNIDLQNIVLTGGSAGGHLALITGLLNAIPGSHPCHAGSKLDIKAVVNWFGITDIAKVEQYLRTNLPEDNYAGTWIDGAEKTDSISALYSPVHRVTPQAPPIITLHGALDGIVPYEQATTFHKLLDEAGVKNELVTDPDGNHGGFSEEVNQRFYARIFSFLDEVVE